ncbi:hypothetical protein J2847_006133 [Azospirillum agricola]|nr:hypothetical protein [Azospirillum agricola]
MLNGICTRMRTVVRTGVAAGLGLLGLSALGGFGAPALAGSVTQPGDTASPMK